MRPEGLHLYQIKNEVQLFLHRKPQLMEYSIKEKATWSSKNNCGARKADKGEKSDEKWEA